MGMESLSSSSASAMNRLQSNVVKAFTGYYRLKDFIHALRACKTQAAERALVAKESFAIRTAFKEEVGLDRRYHSVSKLLYIHLLGYPAHFGQVECLKLVASPRLTDKRLGYLGVVLLLDEQQQTLTLVTNSLKSDLNSASPTVVGLALSTLAAIGSVEIAYELADEVERLLSSTNPALRKKAGLCASRLLEKVPDLAEQFEQKIGSLLSDRNHSVILGGIALAQQLIRANPAAVLPQFRSALLPTLVRLLQSLLGNTFSMDYDVGGINDPFLQVQILKLLRALGEGDVHASDSMADVLTHLSASIDSNRNVGQAVLYEALVTILSIRADASLRTMAVNILGRLMSNTTDNNLRYVSLNLLNKFVHEGAGSGSGETVQRHRQTVLECLGDPDISIRRRAVEVSLALINRETIKAIAQQLISTIVHKKYNRDDPRTDELVALVITKLSILAAKFAPTAKWYADTLTTLLGAMADGLQVASKEEIVSTFVRIVNNTDDIHVYATRRLYEGMDRPTEAQVQACAWALGEYGHLLVEAKAVPGIEALLASLVAWSGLPQTTSTAQAYIITALGKLSLKFEPSLPHIKAALQTIAAAHARAYDVLHKATETLALVQNMSLRTIVFAPIPADRKFAIGNVPNLPPSMSAIAEQYHLDRSSSPAPALDVFAELAMLSLNGVSSPGADRPPPGSSFSSLASPLAPKPTEESAGRLFYDSNGIQIFLKMIRGTPGPSQQILLTAYNRLSSPITGLQVLCAVPKSLRITLDPASGSSVPPSGTVTQLLRVTSSSDEPDRPDVDPSKIKLRLKLTFTPPLSSQAITATFEVNSLNHS